MDSTHFPRRDAVRRMGSLGLIAGVHVAGGLRGVATAAAPNDQIRIGVIGAGHRARQLVRQLPTEARVTAICDCYQPQMQQMLAENRADWVTHTDYRRLIDSGTTDAVIVAVPDHNRTLPCILACQAGLDVYAEKPLTTYVAEGRALVRAVRDHNRICQVGTQQRSLAINEYACRFIREGRLGKIEQVLAVNYPGPLRYQQTRSEPMPAGMDWDQWCGPASLRPYHSDLHYEWRFYREYSGGETTNWGAHGIDIIQWALGKSLTGPKRIKPLGSGPNGAVAVGYGDGVEVRFELAQGPLGGGVFFGSGGKVEINRNRWASNPKGLLRDAPPPLSQRADDPPNWITRPHLQNWIDCIRSRQRPAADVEIGHRTATVCHLINIARELGRELTWDPDGETFIDDPEANGYLIRSRRRGYELPRN